MKLLIWMVLATAIVEAPVYSQNFPKLGSKSPVPKQPDKSGIQVPAPASAPLPPPESRMPVESKAGRDGAAGPSKERQAQCEEYKKTYNKEHSTCT